MYRPPTLNLDPEDWVSDHQRVDGRTTSSGFSSGPPYESSTLPLDLDGGSSSGPQTLGGQMEGGLEYLIRSLRGGWV